MRLSSAFCLLAVTLAMFGAHPANAQVTPFLGEIRFVSFNFPPQGWAFCAGQMLSVRENPGLFQLIGTTYGGDGINTFALPDAQGRMLMGAGTGAGLSQRFLGQTGGQERVTLTIAQMPKHRHALRASSAAADSKAPAGEVLANVPGKATYNSQTADAKMNSNAIGTTGGSQPVATMPPFLGLSCIIALEGIFPSQNSVQKP